MAGQLVTLLLAGLRVTTSTPDALCPPLAAAQGAIAARVGEIRDAELVANYRVVRGEAGDHLVLELSDETTGAILLHRELPLSELSCADSSTVIALQLESYFAGLSPGAEETHPGEQPGPVGGVPPTPTAAAPAIASAQRAAPEETVAGPRTAAENEKGHPTDAEQPSHGPVGFSLTGSLSSLNSPLIGLAAQFSFASHWNLHLWSAFSLGETAFSEFYAQGASYSAWLGLSGRYHLGSGRWSFDVGPTLTTLVQSVWVSGPGASGVDVAASSGRFRGVFGFGGEAAGSYAVSRAISLDFGVRAGPLLSSATRQFLLRVEGTDQMVPIFAAPDFFAQGWLALTFWPG